MLARFGRSASVHEPFRACPGLGYSPATMVAAWLHSYGKRPAWLDVPERQVVLTHQGRTGLGLLCHLLGLGPGDEVLLPAYNCGAEVDPFVHAGCKVIFYRIDRAAKADLADIRSRMSRATRLVYVTHFFGWPQEFEELVEDCRQRDVLLVEDCAQALFSGGDSNLIGKIGDAVIYSFVKSLALPDGGALVLKNQLSGRIARMRRPRAACTLRTSLPLFKKWFMQTNTLWQSRAWSRQCVARSWRQTAVHQNPDGRQGMLSSNRFPAARRFWTMSRVSLGVLGQTNAQDVVERRRRNFARLHAQLNNPEQLQPLYSDLPSGICPMAYPVYARDPARVRSTLEGHGILIGGWPGYYPGMTWDDYPNACALKNNLLTLPVHQDLTLTQIDYIASCANRLGS